MDKETEDGKFVAGSEYRSPVYLTEHPSLEKFSELQTTKEAWKARHFGCDDNSR
jgi:hypothetical protein